MPRSQKKLVCGVGVNDADYATHPTISGKIVTCQFYQRWASMLYRCYSTYYRDLNSSYDGCTVCDGWKSFMGFRAWMINQNWRGLQLDKDLLIPGNKLYSPDTCIFVSQQVNTILSDHAASRGKYPLGVNKSFGSFYAKAYLGNGKPTYLGCFESVEEASSAYGFAKAKHIRHIASQQTDPRITAGLLRHANRYEQGLVV